jgi:hypothetical protein
MDQGPNTAEGFAATHRQQAAALVGAAAFIAGR